jgi:CheY-like chemotaxis protein
MVKTLIAEDDLDTREILRVVLEENGYAVADVEDGSQALAALQTSTVPMVVLLDLDLPRLDGVGVLEAIAQDTRQLARHAYIVLTALVRHRFQAAEELCATLGVPLVLKPFDVEELLALVAAAALRLPSDASDGLRKPPPHTTQRPMMR